MPSRNSQIVLVWDGRGSPFGARQAGSKRTPPGEDMCYVHISVCIICRVASIAARQSFRVAARRARLPIRHPPSFGLGYLSLIADSFWGLRSSADISTYVQCYRQVGPACRFAVNNQLSAFNSDSKADFRFPFSHSRLSVAERAKSPKGFTGCFFLLGVVVSCIVVSRLAALPIVTSFRWIIPGRHQ